MRGSEEMKINSENIKLLYETRKIKEKLNVSADIVKAIDIELQNLNLIEEDDLDTISERIMTIRDGVRDLVDFMRE